MIIHLYNESETDFNILSNNTDSAPAFGRADEQINTICKPKDGGILYTKK